MYKAFLNRTIIFFQNIDSNLYCIICLGRKNIKQSTLNYSSNLYFEILCQIAYSCIAVINPDYWHQRSSQNPSCSQCSHLASVNQASQLISPCKTDDQNYQNKGGHLPHPDSGL